MIYIQVQVAREIIKATAAGKRIDPVPELGRGERVESRDNDNDDMM